MNARIGIYTVGLSTYWNQFPGLKERLETYNCFIAGKIENYGCEVFNFGLVDCVEKANRCGEYFNEHNVDLIFLHCGTYSTSASIVPVHRICKSKTVILNLQPCRKVNYEKTTTGEWLAHCNACAVPEICNAFLRCGIEYHVVNGLLGLGYTPEISLTDENTESDFEAVRAWKEIYEWVNAAKIVRNLGNTKFGFLGNTYSGMLDLYSDFTAMTGQLGINIEILEMCDLKKCYDKVGDKEIQTELENIKSVFEIGGDGADPRVKKPNEEQLSWSAKIAAAQKIMVSEYNLGALAYYYHGSDETEYETLQQGFIVGHSLLTANGIPCAGEGDLKTAVAMKICDILGFGGSFCEIVTTDYDKGTILLGHDGPFHIKIAEGKPILRGMEVYHGKRGTGVSVEAKVRKGPITNIGLTQKADGKLKFMISEGESVDGEIMKIGNTQTHVKFSCEPDAYMDKWFKEAPIHHFAMSVGNNASQFEKTAMLLGIEYVII